MNIEKIGVFVVEKQELVREGLRALLTREADVELMGVSDDGQDALTRIPLLRVNVVLLDITVIDKSDTNIIAHLRQSHPASKMIVLANHSREDCVHATLKLGVAGYVLKHDSHADLMMGIRSVVNGKTYLSPSISQFVVTAYLAQSTSGSNRRASATDRRNRRLDRRNSDKVSHATDALTQRECQVIKLIAVGRKNKEIAKTLAISSKTVEKHRANLMKKLDRHSISQLVQFAMENGLLADVSTINR